MPRALMLIDVRDFHEEAYDLRGSASHGHTGRHLENLIRLMRHAFFDNYGHFSPHSASSCGARRLATLIVSELLLCAIKGGIDRLVAEGS